MTQHRSIDTDGNGALLRCPVCKARCSCDDLPSTPCRRCSADLTSLRHALLAAVIHEQNARNALGKGTLPRALSEASRAVRLHDTPRFRRTLASIIEAVANSPSSKEPT